MSWSADGSLTGYVFDSNEYNNWQQPYGHISVSYWASESGSQYTYTFTTQNADTYYAVLYDGLPAGSNSIEDYSFSVTVPITATTTTTTVYTTTFAPTTTTTTNPQTTTTPFPTTTTTTRTSVPPTTTTTTTTTIPTTTYTGTPDQTFNSAATETVPAAGVYLQPGQTITVAWSASGNLTGYVFSSNQYNNWQKSHLSVTYDAGQSGNTMSFSYTIQNADTYYIVLYDGASVFANSVEDYSFTVKVR